MYIDGFPAVLGSHGSNEQVKSPERSRQDVDPLQHADPPRAGGLVIKFLQERFPTDPELKIACTDYLRKYGQPVAAFHDGESRGVPFKSLDQLLTESRETILAFAHAAAVEARQARGEG